MFLELHSTSNGVKLTVNSDAITYFEPSSLQGGTVIYFHAVEDQYVSVTEGYEDIRKQLIYPFKAVGEEHVTMTESYGNVQKQLIDPFKNL